MATLLFFYPLKFKMPAYWLLPLWLVAELFYGSAHGQFSPGQFSPVAHWAHVGGFLFGMLGANVVRRSGLEQQANEAIESELGWMSNPDIVGASDAMDQGHLDEAAAALQKHLTANPPSIDALNLLQLVQWRRQDMPAYLQATSGLVSEYQDGDSGRRGSLQAPRHRHTQIGRDLTYKHADTGYVSRASALARLANSSNRNRHSRRRIRRR